MLHDKKDPENPCMLNIESQSWSLAKQEVDVIEDVRLFFTGDPSHHRSDQTAAGCCNHHSPGWGEGRIHHGC